MNYIEQFMKYNDIEVNEEFYVINKNGKKIGGLISAIFYFNKNMHLKVKCAESDCRGVLIRLMSGEFGIEKIPQKPKSVWDLKYGDDYWYINSFGHVRKTSYGLEDDFKRMIEFGNAFLTEEEAKHEVERRKCEAILLKYGTRSMMSLGDKTKKYYIMYNYNSDKIEICIHYYLGLQGTINFKTEELAQKAIDEVTEERMKKYVFNVKE